MAIEIRNIGRVRFSPGVFEFNDGTVRDYTGTRIGIPIPELQPLACRWVPDVAMIELVAAFPTFEPFAIDVDETFDQQPLPCYAIDLVYKTALKVYAYYTRRVPNF